MSEQDFETMLHFISLRNELTRTEANDTFVTSCNTLCRLFNLNKEIAFNTDAGGCLQQINLHPLLSTMKIEYRLIIHSLHPKGPGTT